jgi:hypothetical protein
MKEKPVAVNNVQKRSIIPIMALTFLMHHQRISPYQLNAKMG